jgi:glycine betaine/proline transport system ATP-binding protein
LSGSGKSTLGPVDVPPDRTNRGDILFKGENLLTASQARMIEIRRHQMGMVFQHFALLPHLTVLDNVAFPLDIQGMSRPHARPGPAR